MYSSWTVIQLSTLGNISKVIGLGVVLSADAFANLFLSTRHGPFGQCKVKSQTRLQCGVC